MSNILSHLEQLRDSLPDYAKDIRLNLGTLVNADGAPDLSDEQRLGIFLASAYATKNSVLITALENDLSSVLSAEYINAARAAAAIMAMNNVYYRFVHLSNDAEIKSLPAKLRMNIIGNPQIAKVDFELMSLAVSAINGCGMCMEAHLHEVGKAGISKIGSQSAVRIAAVVNAFSHILVTK
jgi:alkyl hydroperoxide reductase subunit D